MLSAFPSWSQDLDNRIAEIRSAGLWREPRVLESAQGARIKIGGRCLWNFSSNDYLGLAGHPAVVEAARQAAMDFGAGAGASRLVCGSLRPHLDLEEALADFKETEAALTFSTGYAAATGTIGALLERDDILIVDKLVHACVVDAARASQARLRVFAHNDLEDLERILRWARAQTGAGSPRRVLIVTESVFSMDGDVAPLAAMVELKDRYGAWLMVDEAHATGLFGERRSGLVSALGLRGRVEVQMSTLGKALGASGGCIAGSRALVDFLVNRARSYIFSTAPPPAAVGAARAALEVLLRQEGELRCARAWEHARSLLAHWPAGAGEAPACSSTILPLLLGGEQRTMDLAGRLREMGFLVPGIRFPTVARGRARLRFTVSADHQPSIISDLGDALAKALAEIPPL